MSEQVLYKLTDQDGYTRRGEYNEMLWSLGNVNVATGARGQGLCSDEYLHAYESPLLAVLLNPIHADIRNPKLWKCSGFVEQKDGQLKCGTRQLKVLGELTLPVFTDEAKIRFAIYCGYCVFNHEPWRKWAINWLNRTDRTSETTRAAAEMAWAAWEAAAAAAEEAEAAAEAAWAAWEAADTARAAEVMRAAWEAADTARAAAEAMRGRMNFKISFHRLAELALSEDWQKAIKEIEEMKNAGN